MGEQIEVHFQDGCRWGVSIAYSRESSPRGTAGALKLAEPLLDDQFLLLNGDTYLPIDYAVMTRHFKSQDSFGLIAVCNNTDEVAPNNIALNPDGSVGRYEKAGGVGLTHVAAGACLPKKAALAGIPGGTSSTLEEELVAKCVPRGKLMRIR